MNLTPEQRNVHDALIKEFIARGKLIEVGFLSMRATVIAPDAPDVQVREMRMAYMSGAQHLFASIMACLDPGKEPTLADMRRMSQINDELEAFGEELKLRVSATAGGAH